jgi:hypothetical protein
MAMAMEVMDTGTGMAIVIIIMVITVTGTGVASIGMLPSAVVGGAAGGTATVKVPAGAGRLAATSGFAVKVYSSEWNGAGFGRRPFCAMPGPWDPFHATIGDFAAKRYPMCAGCNQVAIPFLLPSSPQLTI